ncbi:MAG TPA: hypothetical protein VF045_01760 [Acidimicrobiales bacterium]
MGGGAATPEQVAALTAALEVVLAEEPVATEPSPWRWAGRGAAGLRGPNAVAGLRGPNAAADRGPDWRRSGLPTHPSRP